VAQLRPYSAELESLKTRTALISFSTSELAKQWVTETEASFQFLLDPGRDAYQAYSLEHSLGRAWSPKVWLEYARLIISGRKWRGIQGDSGQMGGDFIVDRNGILRLAYRSHDPTDRPPVHFLLEQLSEINNLHIGET
jgi:peroxiredoxin